MDSYISSAKLPLTLTSGVQSNSGEVGKSKAEENGSRVDQETERQKPYHRHTREQIQEMEAIFKGCPYPDQKRREELSKKLQLAPRQIKSWFQNRRKKMKVERERHHNAALRNEIERLRRENQSFRDIITNPTCYKCEVRSAMQQLSRENARLKNKAERERHHNAALRKDIERLRRENQSFRDATTNPTCYKCKVRSVMQQLSRENTRLKNTMAKDTLIKGKICGRPLPHMASLSGLHNASLGVAAISASPKSYCDYGKTVRETIPTNDHITFSESDSC